MKIIFGKKIVEGWSFFSNVCLYLILLLTFFYLLLLRKFIFAVFDERSTCVLTLDRSGQADRVNATDEVVVAERVPHRRADARHDAHRQDHVVGISQLQIC